MLPAPSDRRTAWRDVLIAEVNATSSRRPKSHRIAASVIATAILGAAAVAVVISATPQASDNRLTVSDRAPVMLIAAAQRSIGDPVPGPGQFLRVRTRAEYIGMDGDGNGYLSPEVHETFLPSDPTKPVIERITHFKPTTFYGTSGAAVAAKDWAETAPTGTGETPKVSVERDDPAPAPVSFPEDPPQLLEQLRATDNPASQSITEHLFEQLADIIRRPGATTEERATAYRALALVPGIIIAANSVVLDGSSGTAFAVSTATAGKSQEIVIDPISGHYIGERLVLSETFGNMPVGTVLELTAVTTSVVDSAPRPSRAATAPRELPKR